MGIKYLRCLSHRGLRRLSTVTLFDASFFFRNYFCRCLVLLLLKPQNIPKKRRQAWFKKPSSKKHYKRPLSREKRNTRNTFLEGLVKRVLNDKSENNNNKMAYGYYPKLLKQYEKILPWLNQTTIGNQLVFLRINVHLHM